MCPAVAPSFLYVNPYGGTAPCAMVRHTMGNVRRTPLREIWGRFTGNLDIPCRGHCLLNDPTLRPKLRDYMAALSAMDPEPLPAGPCENPRP